MPLADYWTPVRQILIAENPGARERLGRVDARSEAGGRELVLVTSSPEAAAWLKNGSGVIGRTQELMPQLDGAAPKVSVRLVSQPAAAGQPPPPVAREKSLAAKFTFANFATGSSNEIAFGAAVELAASGAGGGEHLCPLYIHGGVGLGKTHLANAIGNEYLRRNRAARVRALSGEQFMREVQRDFTSDQVERFRRRFRELDLFILDDLQLIGRESSQSHKQLAALFNFLSDQSRPFVVVSDSPPQQLRLPARLVSRLTSGVQARIDTPDLETRLGILALQADQLGLSLPDDCARLLAENLRSNGRELIGALRRVAAASSSMRKALPLLDIIRGVLADLHSIPGRVTVACIVEAVAADFGLTRRDLLSKRRTRILAGARHAAMYLCRELTAESLPGIAAFFGCHHSSVLHAHRKIAEELPANPELEGVLQRIQRSLKT